MGDPRTEDGQGQAEDDENNKKRRETKDTSGAQSTAEFSKCADEDRPGVKDMTGKQLRNDEPSPDRHRGFAVEE